MKNRIYFFLLLFGYANISLIVVAQNIADEDPFWRTDSAKIHQKIDYIFIGWWQDFQPCPCVIVSCHIQYEKHNYLPKTFLKIKNRAKRE